MSDAPAAAPQAQTTPNPAPTPTPTPAPAPTEVLGNDPGARNPDGTIKDPAAAPKAAEPPKPPKAAEGAPEKYEAFTLPEGQKIDDAILGDAQTLFKELNLPQAAAQKIIDLHSKVVGDVNKRLEEAYTTMRNGWRDEVAKSADLGDGKGLKSEVLGAIGKAIATLPAAEATAFREAMDLTGAGDNPAVVRALYLLAQRVGEGTQVRGGGPIPDANAKPKSGAAALFPNLPSSQAS